MKTKCGIREAWQPRVRRKISKLFRKAKVKLRRNDARQYYAITVIRQSLERRSNFDRQFQPGTEGPFSSCLTLLAVPLFCGDVELSKTTPAVFVAAAEISFGTKEWNKADA